MYGFSEQVSTAECVAEILLCSRAAPCRGCLEPLYSATGTPILLTQALGFRLLSRRAMWLKVVLHCVVESGTHAHFSYLVFSSLLIYSASVRCADIVCVFLGWHCDTGHRFRKVEAVLKRSSRMTISGRPVALRRRLVGTKVE